MAEGCGIRVQLNRLTRSSLERDTIKGDSPVEEDWKVDSGKRVLLLGYAAERWVTLTPNPKYVLESDSELSKVTES